MTISVGKILLVVVLLVALVGGVLWLANQATAPRPAPPSVSILTPQPTPTPYPPQPTPTPYPVQPTPTPYPAQATPTPYTVQSTPVPTAGGLVPYEQEGGIPYTGTSWSADVAPDEVEVLTAGPAKIAGVTLPGGVDRGSVIVLLPDSSRVVHYTVTSLVTGANWHGAYRPLTSPRDEATWRALANDRVQAMMVAPNCTAGTGCKVVDVLIIGPGSRVIAQWTVK